MQFVNYTNCFSNSLRLPYGFGPYLVSYDSANLDLLQNGLLYSNEES